MACKGARIASLQKLPPEPRVRHPALQRGSLLRRRRRNPRASSIAMSSWLGCREITLHDSRRGLSIWQNSLVLLHSASVARVGVSFSLPTEPSENATPVQAFDFVYSSFLLMLYLSFQKSVCTVVKGETYLVAVAPGVSLHAQVLVGVLRAVLDRRQVALVLPVLVPLDPGVCGGDDERGHDDVDGQLAPELFLLAPPSTCRTLFRCARNEYVPAVAAACSLTANRSRLKALSYWPSSLGTTLPACWPGCSAARRAAPLLKGGDCARGRMEMVAVRGARLKLGRFEELSQAICQAFGTLRKKHHGHGKAAAMSLYCFLEHLHGVVGTRRPTGAPFATPPRSAHRHAPSSSSSTAALPIAPPRDRHGAMSRPRFLNPGKLALLHLIGFYCDGFVPPHATIDVLSYITARLVPNFASGTPASATSQFEVVLPDLKDLLSREAPDDGQTPPWVRFAHVLCHHRNLNDLFNFFARDGRLDHLFYRSKRRTPEQKAEIHLVELHPASLIGIFVRRARLEFDRLTFHEAVALWQDYTRFRAPATEGLDANDASLGQLDADDNFHSDHFDVDDFVDNSDGNIAAVLALARESGMQQPHHDALPQKISRDDMEKLLEFQVTQMQSRALPIPKAAQPCSPQRPCADRDYPSSFENLHRYYDYALNGKDRSRYPYALLNMAILQFTFGCYDEAIAAIHETITTAREHKDMVCLNFSLSWLHHFRTIHRAYGDGKFDNYISESDAQGLAFLKTKAQENKMWSVLSSALLSEARLYLAKGHRPRHAIARLVESAELNNTFAIATVESSLLHVQASVYARLGITSMSTAYSNVILQCLKTQVDAEDLIRARCRLAYISAVAGEYAAADRILASISLASYQTLRLHQLIANYTNLVKLKKSLHHNHLRAAQTLLESLVSGQDSEPEFRAHAALLSHDRLVRAGNFSDAFENLKNLIAAAERADADVALRARLLVAKARLFARAGRAQKGLTLALRAVAAAREVKIMPVLFDAIGALGTVLIVAGSSQEAEKIVESVVYLARETEDLSLVASLQGTLADACWTTATGATKVVASRSSDERELAGDTELPEEKKLVEETLEEAKTAATRRALVWLLRAAAAYEKLEDVLGQIEMCDKAEMLYRVLGDEGHAKEMSKKKTEAARMMKDRINTL
ncbi:hypothetical protein FH972_024090 [Carpinus fangiana]|uniref:Anaphase-promoting complex subunit 5 n=1 Tax=Carpinus fangiana TaxID=176857 RepID=A0A5N6KXI3_9ROSI|nr:hypothetical protein FH972_024090 [Carpinus fangiana]